MQAENKIELFKVRSFSDKFSVTVEFLQQNFRDFFKIALVIIGPLAVLQAITIFKFSQSMFNYSTNMAVSDDPFSSLFGLYTETGFFGFLVLFFLVNILVSITFFAYMKLYHDKYPEPITVKDVLALDLQVLLKVVGYNFMMSLIAGLGFLFFLIPGVYLFVVLSLGIPAIIFEGIGVFEALDRSFKLIKEKWWSTFGLIIVASILSFFISLLFQVPSEIFVFVWAKLHPDTFTEAQVYTQGFSTYTVLHLLFSIIAMFGGLISYSFTQFALGFQYTNLVERRDSVGLMKEIENLDGEKEQKH